MLKIAAADKSWLQQLVLTERRRLASLHRSAIVTAAEEPNTETAKQDHEGDAGYKSALEEKKTPPKDAGKEASRKQALMDPQDVEGVGNDDLETLYEAANELENMHQDIQPSRIFRLLNRLMEPGKSMEQYVQEAEPMLRMASRKKANDAAEKGYNDPNGYAVESHEEGKKEGEKGYINALEPSDRPGKKEAKTASELKYDDCGTPPNTSTATQDHDFELKALAKQISGLTSGKTEWDPNTMLLD